MPHTIGESHFKVALKQDLLSILTGIQFYFVMYQSFCYQLWFIVWMLQVYKHNNHKSLYSMTYNTILILLKSVVKSFDILNCFS